MPLPASALSSIPAQKSPPAPVRTTDRTVSSASASSQPSFYRADLQSADLTGADLTGADLVRANLDEAVLRSARLDGADMVKASLHGVDASGASFRGTRIMGASLFRVDLRGADLTDAVLSHNSFRVTVDDATVVRGLTGTVFGPVTVFSGESSRELAGAELEAWFGERGGQVEVIAPGRPPK
ncbi:pentapeptide repeat-containing protein [Streptomyces lavendulae]